MAKESRPYTTKVQPIGTPSEKGANNMPKYQAPPPPPPAEKPSEK